MFFGWHGMLHVIYATLIRFNKPQKYTLREIIPDPQLKEPITMDWIDTKILPDRYTVLILPGLAGSSETNYVTNLVQELKHMYNVVVYCRPGSTNIQLTHHRFFLNSHPLTIKYLIEQVYEKQQNNKHILVIGFSLGGQNIIRTLGEYSDLPVLGVITVNQPFDSKRTTQSMEENPIYSWALARTFRNYVKSNEAIFKKDNLFTSSELESILAMNTLRDFYELFTKRLHEFKDMDREFYDHRTITTEHLRSIQVPTVIIQSMDDNVVQPRTLAAQILEFLYAKENDNIMLVQTEHGGHCAYNEMSKLFLLPAQLSWIERLCPQLLNAMIITNQK